MVDAGRKNRIELSKCGQVAGPFNGQGTGSGYKMLLLANGFSEFSGDVEPVFYAWGAVIVA
jgi:hypothetical protein